VGVLREHLTLRRIMLESTLKGDPARLRACSGMHPELASHHVADARE
jgi:hypothetical protein